MTHYTVEWTIDVDADDPATAARIAQRIMRDPASTANVFVVFDNDNDTDPFVFDLDDLAERPPCGHSACVQNWIDTGEGDCVEGDDDYMQDLSDHCQG